jgi:hypothetical protein
MHPRDYPINRRALDEMQRAARAPQRPRPSDPLPSALWELEWAWEEIAQLQAALALLDSPRLRSIGRADHGSD